jgi:hypothetical protein
VTQVGALTTKMTNVAFTISVNYIFMYFCRSFRLSIFHLQPKDNHHEAFAKLVFILELALVANKNSFFFLKE